MTAFLCVGLWLSALLVCIIRDKTPFWFEREEHDKTSSDPDKKQPKQGETHNGTDMA